MKTIKIIASLILLCSYTGAEAQLLKKLGKRATQAAERALERKVEEKSEMETEKKFDSIFNNETRAEKRRRKRQAKKQKNTSNTQENTPTTSEQSEDAVSETVARSSDFIPGEQTLFEDDFMSDGLGDFPVKWDTNGSGEVASMNNMHWFRLAGNSLYYPMLEKSLPENYTITFDLLFQGLDNKTSSQAYLKLLLAETEGFQKSNNWCMVEISPSQFIESQGVVEKVVDGKRQLRNKIGKDFRDMINGRSQISIAVNKTRMRVWLNDNKLIDIPRLVPEAASAFKIQTMGLRDAADKDEVYISNFRIGAAGEDNRSTLITEGRLSTNAILFESGSANLKGESYAVIAQIAQVLKENEAVSIQIIGHTDGDGPDSGNLTLSRKRAQAVKQAMITAYGIDSSRMQTDGMGESQPIADNSTPAGKAQNRRVEFIKL